MSDKTRPIIGVALMTPGGKLYGLPAPKRHGDVIRWLAREGYDPGFIAQCEQGFTGSDGAFLSREKAMEVAREHGLIRTVRVVDGIERAHEPTGSALYSEDLW